jgi:hypothetical protein
MRGFISRSKRWIVAGVAATALSGGAFAFANSLTVTTGRLGVGGVPVPAPGCDAQASYGTIWVAGSSATAPNGFFEVSSVTVTGEAPAGSTDNCAGDMVHVVLTGTGPGGTQTTLADLGTMTLSGSPPTATFTLPPPVIQASQVTNIEMSVTGP